MKKIFITGGSGMLGSHLAAQAVSSGWEAWATYSSHPVEIDGCHMLKVDVTDPVGVRRAISDVDPDVVVNTAANVKPDDCEQHKAGAFAVNTLGALNVASAAESAGAHFIQISTDLVFRGESAPYQVQDTISPVNYYGMTKASAEVGIYGSGAKWAIVRTTVIYGPRKFPSLASFSDKVIESLRAGKTLSAYVDQYRPAVPVWNLADAILEIAERRVEGIYHVVCPELSSRHQFACKVAEVFGLDQSLIQPIYMDETPAIAPRPKMLVLDTISTSRVLNTHLLGFEEGILELKRRM